MDCDTLVSMYYSFIYPYLNYCIAAWGSCFKSYLNKVLLLQKKVVRIISGADRLAHTDPLFASLDVLKIDQLYSYNIGLMMYKYYHNLLPSIFDDFFQKNSEIHSHLTRRSIVFTFQNFDQKWEDAPLDLKQLAFGIVCIVILIQLLFVSGHLRDI